MRIVRLALGLGLLAATMILSLAPALAAASVPACPAGQRLVHTHGDADEPATCRAVPAAKPRAASAPTVASPGSPAVIATIPVGLGPNGIAANPNTNRIYVASADSNSISVIDGTSNTVIATITDPRFVEPDAIQVDPTRNLVYALALTPGDVRILVTIDGATNTVLRTLAIGSERIRLAVDPVRDRVYIISNGDFGTSELTVVQGSANTILYSGIDVGFEPADIAVDRSTGMVYIARDDVSTKNGTDSAIDLYDPQHPTGGIAKVYYAALGLSGIGVNSQTHRVYAANDDDGTVTELKVTPGTTFATMTTIDVSGTGISAHRVGVDESSNRIYVSIEDADTVAVINGKDQVIAYVNVGLSPADIAVNTTTGWAYVVNADDNTVSVIG